MLQVLWYAGGTFQTYCAIDITYFPFGIQTCSVEVVSWSMPNSVLNGTFGDPAWDFMDLMEDHPEWALFDASYEYELRPTNYWTLSYRYRLKRKPLFYIVNIILPLTLLSFLNCLVFLLPTESGEKMTVSVTSFFSLALFVSFVHDTLPRNSDSVCYFSVYVTCQMFLSLCSTVICAIIVNVANRDQRFTFPSGSSSVPQGKGNDARSSDFSTSRFDRSSKSQSTGFDFLTRERKGGSEAINHHDLIHKEKSSTLGALYDKETVRPRVMCDRESETPEASCGGGTETCRQEAGAGRGAGHWRGVTVLLDKVFLAVMICVNLLSCLVFMFLMTRAR